MVFRSSSSTKTKKVAAALAKKILQSSPRKSATVFALQGELGAGKTTFAQGFLKGLGVKEKTASPTFIIMRQFTIPNRSKTIRSESQKPYTLNPNRYTLLYHIDAYRISTREAGVLGLKEIFRDPKNIVLIEWPENIKKLIPKDAMWIQFEHKTKTTRSIKMKTAPR